MGKQNILFILWILINCFFLINLLLKGIKVTIFIYFLTKLKNESCDNAGTHEGPDCLLLQHNRYWSNQNNQKMVVRHGMQKITFHGMKLAKKL